MRSVEARTRMAPEPIDIPEPPMGKKGWPWGLTTQHLKACQPTPAHDEEWPAITIVTSSYNEESFIEETIRSVLLQGYPNLEYIIIDKSSQDKSLSIIKKYEPWLTYRLSQPDDNCSRARALNEGLKKATGTIVSWLNPGDTYLPGALFTAAKYLSTENPFIFGDCYLTDKDSSVMGHLGCSLPNLRDILKPWVFEFSEGKRRIIQSATFFLKSLTEEIGFLDESLKFAIDYDFWVRASARHRFHYVDQALSTYRLDPFSESGLFPERTMLEAVRVSREKWGPWGSASYWHYWASYRKSKYVKWIEKFKSLSEQNYKIASEHWKAKNVSGTRKFIFNSFLYFPPNFFRAYYLSLFMRAFLGESFVKHLSFVKRALTALCGKKK